MQGYAPAGGGGEFAESREYYREVESWLGSEQAAGLQHAELEEQMEARGRELTRRLFQDHLELQASREVRRGDVTGADGIARTRAEKGHGRPLATKFGQVTVSRMAYRAPGAANVHPLDAALNLPEEKHSHGLRKLAAIESVRGSHQDAAAAVTRATGVKIGKRQVEELALRAAADVDGFYDSRRPDPAPDDHALVITCDGKGVVMRPEALRPATARAAASAEGKLATRLSPGEKHGRKRMAELACVYDAAPVPRAPEDIITPPGKKKQAGTDEGKGRREPQARGKWLTASVTSDIPAVITAAFDEAERRDPDRRREWIALADGNNTQIEAVTAEAARRGVTVTIIIDLIHVLEYLWKAAWSFFDKGEPAAEGMGRGPGTEDPAGQGPPGSGRDPPPRHQLWLPRPGARRRRRVRPLPHRQGPAPGLPRRTPERLAHRHRDHRGCLQAHRKGQNGHNRRKMGTRRRRGHPQAPRPHRQRRLRTLLALPPAQGTRTHPRRPPPRKPRPRSVTSSL